MKQSEIVDHLAALLEAKVLSPVQVLNAAFTAGWDQANSTYESRKIERNSAIQLAAQKDRK